MSAQDTSFARLVSLACHDLRTPLATVSGFAKTLVRMEGLEEQVERYLGMIDVASGQLGELLELLGLAARIEDGRWEPLLAETDSLELARAAAAERGDLVSATGSGVPVAVDVEAATRALAALASCAVRHGGIPAVELRVDGAAIDLVPVAPDVCRICLGDELRDLGAAVASRTIVALGGSVEAGDGTLAVRLPLAGI